MINENIEIATVRKLHQAGQLEQAQEGYLAIIQRSPNCALAYNNVGTIYYAQGKLPEAIQAYRHALTLQSNYVDAYYNLGLALVKQQQFDEAVIIYKKLLEYAPKHDAARFHLAGVFMRQENLSAALNELLMVEAAQPHHFETQTNLATCYLKQGALKEAKQHYLNALALMPDDTQILYNLGVISMQEGYVDQAIQYYQRTLRINFDLFFVHNNLGIAFLAKQHAGLALQHFREALRLQPNNEAISYIVTMLTQHQPLLAAPTAYIQSLFDSYADHYEPHLLNALDYKIPQIFYEAATKQLNPHAKLDILDLGCGTGLCGTVFKPLTKTLIGVDLSPKMLEVAKEKNIYDQLILSEMNTFLQKNSPAAYDLIMAGDVFVYAGELENIFKMIRRALRAKGLFIFNTEISEDADYRMNQSGRFLHTTHYLNTLAERNAFRILSYKTVVTRLQNNEPVYGHLYILSN